MIKNINQMRIVYMLKESAVYFAENLSERTEEMDSR